MRHLFLNPARFAFLIMLRLPFLFPSSAVFEFRLLSKILPLAIIRMFSLNNPNLEFHNPLKNTGRRV